VSSTGADIGIPGGITRTAVSVLSTVSRTTEEMATTTTTTTTTSTATTKTIFLVRHAESDENRRLHSLKTAFKDLTRFALPKSKDVLASCELIRIDQQIDSNVSQFGKQQIAYMANTLREADFVAQQKVQLLVHSPLLRAKETCRDLFGCVLSNTSDETSPLLPPPQSSSNHHNITEVIELDLLTEMTPMEWIPGNAGSLQKRMSALETWLSERPENTIVCVGHSQYFKAMLRLPYKFQNCDVIRVQFDPFTVENTTTGATKWSNIQNEHLCRITPTSNDTCHQSNNHSSTPSEKESDSVVAK
jgi:broad specificity phosphatase PhoE